MGPKAGLQTDFNLVLKKGGFKVAFTETGFKEVSKNYEFFTSKNNIRRDFQMCVLNAMQATFFEWEHSP